MRTFDKLWGAEDVLFVSDKVLLVMDIRGIGVLVMTENDRFVQRILCTKN